MVYTSYTRAADAAVCPHLALAAIVHAGIQGIEEGLSRLYNLRGLAGTAAST